MSGYYQLPTVAVPFCISDIQALPVKESGGKNVRVCGRVNHYNPVSEVLWLVEPQRPFNLRQATQRQGRECPQETPPSNTLLVDTSLIGSFDFCCSKGSLVLCAGELETWMDSRLADVDFDTGREDKEEKSGVVVKATICKPLDGLDYGKYCQYVEIIHERNSSTSIF